MGAALAVATSSDGNRGPLATPTTRPTVATTTTEACTPKPYQPCGEDEPAPNTDGERCTDDHADYDEDPENGCEASPDGLEDESLLDGRLVANLVPTDDVDTYRVEVEDNLQLTCDGEVKVTLTAPPGASMRIRILFEGEELGSAVSGDGVPGTATAREQNCFNSDAGTLLVVVESVGTDRSPDDYELTVRGSF